MLKLFKKDPPKGSAIHPEYKKLTEKIFSIDDHDFYQFKNLLDMPHNRYNKCTRFATEFNMRIDGDELKELLDKSMEQLNKGNVTRSIIIQNQIKERTDMLISIDASYRLASCVYFFKEENLDDYDYEIGDMKIELFKKEKLDSFFLSKPMNNFLPAINLSEEGLRAYLLLERELKKLARKSLTA